MAKSLIEIEKEALELPQKDRATLAQILLETLDEETDEEVEQLWLMEAERRYKEYRDGKIKSRPADEVFKTIRQTL